MNIENLENEMKFPNELGFTLNIDERYIFPIYLFPSLSFWS